MIKSKVELADYVYIVLFKVILLLGMWCNPFFLYEQIDKIHVPKRKEGSNPYLSVLRRNRRREGFVHNTSRTNGSRSIQKVQLQGISNRHW